MNLLVAHSILRRLILFLFACALALPIWAQPPCDDDDDQISGTLTYSGPVCSGGTVTISITLDDDDDDDELYDVTYSIGGNSFFLDNISGLYTVNHTVTTTVTATLISIYDNEDDCLNTINSSILIVVFPQPAPVITNITQPGCGQANGSITANASGGTPPYQYSLDGFNFQSSGTFLNLSPGSYTVTIRDANSCSTSQSGIGLSGANAPFLTISNTTQPACGQANGSIAANASGGTPPYQYSLNGGNFQSSGIFTNLPVGSYTVSVRDANACQDSQTGIQLNDSGTIVLAVTASTPAGCEQANGSLTLSATGGTPPYQYSINGVNFQSGNIFPNLSSGNYQLTVRDAAGCTDVLAFEVGNTSGQLQSATVAEAMVTECPGELTLVSGNLPPGVTGVWSATTAGVVFETPNSAQTVVRANIPGVYQLTWTLSAPGCAAYSSAQVTLIVPVPPAADDDGPEQATNGQTLGIQTASNDNFDEGAVFTLLSQPTSGIASINAATGEIEYTANSGSTSYDTISYVLCAPLCNGQLCDTASVFIQHIEEDCSLEAEDNVLPEGITPNGDGFNDRLHFVVIDESTCPFNYAQSELIIYNRWGDRVFEASPYDNNWDGDNLPHGVYYYVLKVHLQQEFVKFGNVTIFRN
jgi:gliding motility-associated-like protein